MSRTIVLLAASLVALPAAGLAQPSEPISVTAQRDLAIVSYADLDIASAAGKRMLDHRVSGAIEQVCGSFANVREWSEEDRILQCRAAAHASADRQLAARPMVRTLALNIER